MQQLVIIIFCISTITSCVKPDSSIRFIFENNCSVDVDILYPKRYTRAVPFSWGTMYDLDPNDTTSTGAWRAHFANMHLLPHDKESDYSGFDSIEMMSPYDTVRIFVFDGQHHHLPYNEVNINDIYESEDYYCRYDLTSKDLKSLLDTNENIVISFPPSEKMKSVKMFLNNGEVLQESW